MPNSPSPEKRRFSYLENRHVAEWLEGEARERGTDLASLVREATLAYYAASQSVLSQSVLSQSVVSQSVASPSAPSVVSDAERAAEKSARRRETDRAIAQGELTPGAAQQRNAPLPTDARVVDLWGAVRRRAAQR